MEPAKNQLARPLPALRQLHDEIRSIYHATDFTHDIPCNDETEPYTVGSELGLTARFVRNLCDPVAKALTPLPHMDKLTFADIQSIAPIDNVIPDVCLGLVAESADVSNVIMVGELETPWTNFLQPVTVENPSYAPLIEPLMGQVVQQMRHSFVRYAFLSTYNITIFVKRTGDNSFLVSQSFKHDITRPSLRQLFAGFCLLAVEEPEYQEPSGFDYLALRGPPALRQSVRVQLGPVIFRRLPPASASQSLTSTSSVTTHSIIVATGTALSIVVNCGQKLSNPQHNDKAVYSAELDGKRVIAKCWAPELVHLFDAEACVYERMSSTRPNRHDLFPKWIMWGPVVCSSIFSAGHVLILEEREGNLLSKIWHQLSHIERRHVATECARAIRALRAISVRLNDPDMHNILYSRDKRTVTFLDLESAVECDANSYVSPDVEMRAIFDQASMYDAYGG